MNDLHPKTAATLETIHLVAMYSAMARQIDLADVEDILEEYARSHSVMPIIDPTRYMRLMESATVQRNVAMLQAFIKFRKAIDKLEMNDD